MGGASEGGEGGGERGRGEKILYLFIHFKQMSGSIPFLHILTLDI